jgi:HEAT repeat protein
MKERENARLAAIARNKTDAEPVVKALCDSGFIVETVADLFNKKMNYRGAIPVLVAWLPRVSNSDVKQDMVRALSVKWAAHAAPALIAEFDRSEDSTGAGLRWVIGSALEVLSNEDIAQDLIRLASDRRFGKAREMIVIGLGKLKSTSVTDVLLRLLDDEDIVGHAVIALGKLRAQKARMRIHTLLEHPRPWIRREAKKAVSRIDKQTESSGT